jgi:hypothetical protein
MPDPSAGPHPAHDPIGHAVAAALAADLTLLCNSFAYCNCFTGSVIFQLSKPNPATLLGVAGDQGALSPSAFSECQPTDLTDNRCPSYRQWEPGNDPRRLRTYSDERSPLPTGPIRHPMTSQAALPGTVDDESLFCFLTVADE